jgi:formyl-CoA transferase
MYGTAYSGREPVRTGRRHHSIAPYGTFRLADGSTVLIAVQNEREWQRLARVVLDSDELATSADFAGNPARFAHVERLEQLITAALQRLPADQMRALLADQAITVANVNSLQQVWQHPQLRARGRFQQVLLPNGEAELLRSPFDINEMTTSEPAIPALGEHDADVVAQVAARGRARLTQ